jgi:hypothetical protein
MKKKVMARASTADYSCWVKELECSGYCDDECPEYRDGWGCLGYAPDTAEVGDYFADGLRLHE